MFKYEGNNHIEQPVENEVTLEFSSKDYLGTMPVKSQVLVNRSGCVWSSGSQLAANDTEEKQVINSGW